MSVSDTVINSVDEPGFAEVVSWLAAAERVTVLTGAGISTDSGVPDFRGPNGLWTKDPLAERASHIETYVCDGEARRAGWRASFDRSRRKIEPNAGHFALVELERRGRLRGIATQNVDGLHVVAGNSESLVHELHGKWRNSCCLKCHDRRPIAETHERFEAGDDDPHCLLCGGLLKRDVILFGESLDEQVIDAAFRAAEDCDLFFAIGTSLMVTPASNLLPRARSAGARTVIINGQATERDRFATVCLRGDISSFLTTLVAQSA